MEIVIEMSYQEFEKIINMYNIQYTRKNTDFIIDLHEIDGEDIDMLANDLSAYCDDADKCFYYIKNQWYNQKPLKIATY